MGNYEKTVLFLPFLQIPSGHHQVANALIDSIERVNPALKCEKRIFWPMVTEKLKNLFPNFISIDRELSYSL